MADEWIPITSPDDPRLLDIPLNPQDEQPWPGQAVTDEEQPWPGQQISFDLPEVEPESTPVTTYTPGQGDPKMEGGWETASGAPMTTLERTEAGIDPYVTLAVKNRKDPRFGTSGVFETASGKRLPAAVTDVGPGVKGVDVAMSNPQAAYRAPADISGGRYIPTGKKVELETYTPQDITPVEMLETRRAKAVRPEDEPWPGVQVELPAAATAETEIQTQQPPPEDPEDPSWLQKIGTAGLSWVKGMIPKSREEAFRFVNYPTDFTDPVQLAEFVYPGLKSGLDLGRMTQARYEQVKAAEQTPAYSQDRYNAGIGTLLDLGMWAAGAKAGGYRRGAAKVGAAVDETIASRVQPPTAEAGIGPAGDFIDVPFVRAETGSLGERTKIFIEGPPEGQRPANTMLLKPGERTPPPLLGYPEIQHQDGSRTIINPASLEGAVEADIPPIELNPDEAFRTEIETPTPEDLALPTMSAKEFDNYLADLQRQDQISFAQDIAGAGTPVMNFIQDVGGIISKSKAKKTGLYEQAGGALWDDVPKQLTGVDMRHLWNGTETPDNMAMALYNDGLIPEPTVGAMWTAWDNELATIKGTKAPKPIKGFESELPPIAEVQHELELLGLTDQERLIANGTHYVVANPVTGEIRELFPTREQGMDYLQNMASPGEALVRRKLGRPDQLVAKRPDDVTSMQDREIAKVQKATGGDYDQYLQLETETDAQRVAREAAEAKTNEQIQAQRQREKDIKLETKLGFKARKLRGGTGTLGQADIFGGGDLFAQAKPPPPAEAAPGSKGFVEAFATAKGAVSDSYIDHIWNKVQQGKPIERIAPLENQLREAQKAGALKTREDVADIIRNYGKPAVPKSQTEIFGTKRETSQRLVIPAEIRAEGDKILGMPAERVLEELKKRGFSKRAQKVWNAARQREAGVERDWDQAFYEAAADDIGDWEKSMASKMKAKGQAGGISLAPLEPAAKAIRESIERRKLKDTLLAKEGAVENFAVIYPRERMNMVRRDFGLPAEAMKRGTKAFQDLEALAIIEDHGGDINRVRAGRDLVARSKTTAGRALLPKWDYALRNFDRIKGTPNRFRDEMDRQFALEKHNNIPQAYRSDYVSHVFDDDPKGFFGWFTPTAHGAGGTSKWFTKARNYPTIADAVHNGEIPKSLNAADLGELRLRAGQRLILRKAYRELMQTLKAPDGKPVAMDKPTQGYETMKIHGVDVHVHPELADYVAMLFEPSAIRRHAIGRGALTAAGVQKQFQLALDTFHAARLSAYGAGAGKGRTRFGYNRGLAVLELAPEDYARAIQSGEYSPDVVKYAREHRPLMMELLAQGANVGKWSDNILGDLHRLVPGTRTVNRWIFDSLGRGALTQGLLENYKRILKRFPELSREKAARKAVIEMNEHFGNLGRRTIFKHKTFQDASQMLFLARQWVESQFRSEARAYGQMAAYPYNVVEGLVRGQGLKSFGRLGVTAQSRLSLALGLLVAGQILNYALNGKSTFENPEGKKLQVRVPIGDKVYYFDTAQIPFEFSHQIIKYMRKGEGAIGTVAHILENKLSKLSRGAKILATGQSYRGGAVTGPITGRNATTKNLVERGRQLAAEELPFPIFSGGAIEPEPRSSWLFRMARRPDAMAIQAAASLGAKLEPEETPRDKVYKMVREKGMEKPGEDRGPGKYSQLKRALDNGDGRAVQEEMSLLMKETPTRKEKLEMFKNIREVLGIRSMAAIERDPTKGGINQQLFTGRVKDEIQFRRKLSPEERSLYYEAQRQHQRSARFFLMLEPQLKRINIGGQ